MTLGDLTTELLELEQPPHIVNVESCLSKARLTCYPAPIHMTHSIPYNTTQIIVERPKERQTLWNIASFWGLMFFQLLQGVTRLEITLCLSNLKRSVMLGHREDVALFSVTFRERIWLLILPLGFPVL